jgi:hypothetical protein
VKRIALFDGKSCNASFSSPPGGFALVFGFLNKSRTIESFRFTLKIYNGDNLIYSDDLSEKNLIGCNYLDSSGGIGSIIDHDYAYQNQSINIGDLLKIQIELNKKIPEIDSLWLFWTQ